MGILGKIFRSKREEKLVAPPVGPTTPKAPRRKSGEARTRKQIVGRRKAMAGRKANVRRLVKARKS
jgi:hypothetical protein